MIPRCPIHVCAEMVFEPSHAYVTRKRHIATKNTSSVEAADLEDMIKHRKGLWRCSVVGCFQIHAPFPKAEPIRYCTCGAVSDAPQYRRMIGSYRCCKCIQKDRQRWARNRRRRKASETPLRKVARRGFHRKLGI